MSSQSTSSSIELFAEELQEEKRPLDALCVPDAVPHPTPPGSDSRSEERLADEVPTPWTQVSCRYVMLQKGPRHQ